MSKASASLRSRAPIARVAIPWVAAVQALFVAIVIDVAGAVLGAVAVSGLPELEDERFAAIGKAAIEGSLRP